MTNNGEYDEYTTVRHHYPHFPPGVKRADDTTVLKYPLTAGEDLERLEAERQIPEAIPPHKNVLGFKGSADAGIYLERAPNGTVAEYMLDSGKPLSLQQRLAWCRETAEEPTNLLLDKDLHVKLSNFQGKLLVEDGTVLVDGCSMEPFRFSIPRNDFRADVKADLFAPGCTVYFILLDHTIFPDIGDRYEEAWEKVEERLAKKEWPREQQVCSAVTVKC
ncbi:hypothetical protein B0T22DRAFT_502546 [Podospora appendiculata]|uniref:Uncharacterized protein n=1 Tax=Podospora appendiculata TaxID=314037 RepID=A0AAE1C764_9PEZI|nr:hypothetical protein B0T22DRAFT_502546 [Podospora appendiculata]